MLDQQGLLKCGRLTARRINFMRMGAIGVMSCFTWRTFASHKYANRRMVPLLIRLAPVLETSVTHARVPLEKRAIGAIKGLEFILFDCNGRSKVAICGTTG